MISGSTFSDSSIAVSHNAVKSIIFRFAELLLAYTVGTLFSLLAAKGKRFTSYLMFHEDLFQKAFYIFSHKNLNGFLVFGFAIAYTLAQLYGTLLWGLDAPGYIERSKNVSATSLKGSMLPDPGYILSLTIRPNEFSTLESGLPQIIGNNLYKAGVNFTLTGNVNRGGIEITAPTRRGVGPRLWLDDEGLSVSTDTSVTSLVNTDLDGRLNGMPCPVQLTTESSGGWNCTFNNTFVGNLLQNRPVGRPVVHWDDASDMEFDSRYIRPKRTNNIWASVGDGPGSVGMKQMFTVTKGKRRHTFIESVIKFTMITKGGIPFLPSEVSDFVKRTWSTDPEEQKHPLVGFLIESILKAQDEGHSYMYGYSNLINASVVQPHWEYMIMENNMTAVFSIIRISAVNITLIRSETIEKAPVPFESCDASFQNEAAGGRLTETDCLGSDPTIPNPRFFGQVDTSAVLILYGFGDGRSNASSIAYDQRSQLWMNKNSDRIDRLLVSRGFTVSIDPALVTLNVSIVPLRLMYQFASTTNKSLSDDVLDPRNILPTALPRRPNGSTGTNRMALSQKFRWWILGQLTARKSAFYRRRWQSWRARIHSTDFKYPAMGHAFPEGNHCR